MAVPRSHRAFCRALLEETRGEILRWASIDSVADRLGIDQETAEALAAELDEQRLVRVGGGHSVTLGPEGWQFVRKRPRQQRV